jgi:hypothetical protein
LQALKRIFERFALKDQQAYYKDTLEKNRESAQQVNIYRATLALAGGIASALVGVLAAMGNTGGLELSLLVSIAIIAPALGAALASLNTLFQWERLATVYHDAFRSLHVTDALSPPDDIQKDEDYHMYFQAFVDATLEVMHEETGQFGNLIKSPEQTNEFLRRARERADQVQHQATLLGQPIDPDSPSDPPPQG